MSSDDKDGADTDDQDAGASDEFQASASYEFNQDRKASASDVVTNEFKASASDEIKDYYNAGASYETEDHNAGASYEIKDHNAGASDEFKASASDPEQKASASKEAGAAAREQQVLYLLSRLFQCRECGGAGTGSGACENFSNEPCCVGQAISAALSNNRYFFPFDLLSLIESYALASVSRSFLTSPAPRSAGVIQCYIVRSPTDDQLNLFMEIEEQEKYLLVGAEMHYKSKQELSNLSDWLFNGGGRKRNNKTAERKLFDNAISYLLVGKDIFLLRACRTHYWVGSTYTISTSLEPSTPPRYSYNRSDYSVIGKLHSNFGGSQFVMSAPENCNNTNRTSANRYPKRWYDTGIIKYGHFFQVTGSPIQLQVFLTNQLFYQQHTQYYKSQILKQIRTEQQQQEQQALPSLSSADNESNSNQNMLSMSQSILPAVPALVVRDLNDTAESVFDFETPQQQIECYENLRPVFHTGMNAYVLHFDDRRVQDKSVKNFKMVRLNDPEKRTVLQVGRTRDRNRFVMDYSYPLSTIEAFQIAISTIDPKLAI